MLKDVTAILTNEEGLCSGEPVHVGAKFWTLHYDSDKLMGS